MARPIKNNADYHSHDSNMRNDIKIKALRRKYKLAGYAIYNMLLEVLTNAEYFEYEWNDFSVEILAGDFEIEPELLVEIVDYCTNKINLFIIENGFIYSLQHKKRFSSLLSKRKTDRNGVIDVDNTQSKVKESKVNENKENSDFYNCQVYYLENLDRDIYEKLKTEYGITEPLIYKHTNQHPIEYYDLVQHLAEAIKDDAWKQSLITRFGLKYKFTKAMSDYFNLLKTNYEYLNFKDTYDFRKYFSNWFNTKKDNYK